MTIDPSNPASISPDDFDTQEELTAYLRGLIDPSNPVWSGWIPSDTYTKTTCYVHEGCNVSVPPDLWFTIPANQKAKFCRICQPDGVPPFYDCPHGHYLTPSRVQEQMDWANVSELGWAVLVWIAAVGFGGGVGIISAFGTVCFAIFLFCYFLRRHFDKKWLDFLGAAGPWSENPNWKWEPRTRRNEPWIKKVF